MNSSCPHRFLGSHGVLSVLTEHAVGEGSLIHCFAAGGRVSGLKEQTRAVRILIDGP